MTEPKLRAPYYPIIYVRGYAASRDAVEDTVSDPYMGFNLGSTRLRQEWTGELRKFVFESPLVRLMKDYDYRDVYSNGEFMPRDAEPSGRPIVIYRYYDDVSTSFGTGRRPEIEDFAHGLGRLILSLRDEMCPDEASRSAFKVYLVAHSMGGLICRCFLQNHGPRVVPPEQQETMAEARTAVDKVFTYATPHNGIDIELIGNVPAFFSRNNAENFNRARMREYLALPEGSDDESVADLNGRFDPDRFFCLVGTNHQDYNTLMGMAKQVVGPRSDGLVRINNAIAFGRRPGASDDTRHRCPFSFVHRSHGGRHGIVNSEEGYQNLTRFLFGDIRVDADLEIHDISLPPALEKRRRAARRQDTPFEVHAAYHFEAVARVRGARWDLHRRTLEENSAIFRGYDALFHPDRAGLEQADIPRLFSAYLANSKRINRRRRQLGFSIDLGVRVPEYEVDGLAWLDDHFEGGYLYRDKLNLEALPPDKKHSNWRLRYGLDSRTPNRTSRVVEGRQGRDGFVVFRIPIRQASRPGLEADLVLHASPQ